MLHQYSKDILTESVNRTGLEAFLESYTGNDLALLSVQITRFGSVNSSLGGVLANKTITKTSARLQKIFPESLIIARTHGDHFCLAFSEQNDISEKIEKLNDFTQRPLAMSGQIIVLSVRIGVALLSEELNTPSLLLHASEIALQEAKNLHVKTCYFQHSMYENAKQSHDLENDLRLSLVNRHVELHRAMNNDEFVLHYQPIIDVETKEIIAFEALMRWFHPTKGFIPPDKFIPMAEQIQIMDVLGGWVIRKAVADVCQLPPNKQGNLVGISVNVSPVQFSQPEILISALTSAIKENNIDPKRIKIEITESSAFAANMVNTLLKIKELGCEIAMDDFGTGYSSLTQLSLLPLDYLKLDRSFISDIESSDNHTVERSHKLTQAVLTIAETYGLKSIVEGVETIVQLELLKKMGCRLFQGYYFSKPIPFEQAKKLLCD